MKLRNLYLTVSLLLVNCLSITAQNNLIEVPVRSVDGAGPFYIGASPLDYNEENNPHNEYRKGKPDNWKDSKEGRIIVDFTQYYYQNYRSGKITEEEYQDIQDRWKRKIDSTQLSESPVKCTFGYVTGIQPNGEMGIIIDSNNNNDFSDDKAYTIPELAISDEEKIMQNVRYISYQRLSDNVVIEDRFPLVIFKMNGEVWYTIPQYVSGEFDGHKLAVTTFFTNVSYLFSTIVCIAADGTDDGEKYGIGDGTQTGQYLSIGENVYKYLGIKRNDNVVLLEKQEQDKSDIKTAVEGFRAEDFEGFDFKTREKIALSDYKGKYVYLDFWATFCTPCLKDMPELKEIYDNLDDTKAAIIGIVGSSTADETATMIDKHHITWPQILSTDENNIVKDYRVGGYPTTFLIDPDGMILTKRLRARELKGKFRELNLLKE